VHPYFLAVKGRVTCYIFYPPRRAILGIMAIPLCHWLKRDEVLANGRRIACSLLLENAKYEF